MAECVYKYPVDRNDLAAGQGAFAIDLPIGARVVLAGMQHGVVTLWAVVNPDAPRERREFLLRGTGHALPTNAHHVYSFMQDGGAFIWHLFEPTPKDTPDAS